MPDMEKETVFWLHENRIQDLDPVFIFLTDFVTAFTLLVLLLLAHRVFIKKVLPKTYFWLPAVSLILAAVSVNLIKLLVKRPRPYQSFPEIEQLVQGGGYSFPSGHTAEVFVLVFSLWILFKSPVIRIIVLIWALFIAYTRLAFGVHYPVDLAGGITVAAFSVFITKKFILPHILKPNPE
jgi:membrane-associated phospholipid phosphatase